MIKMIATAAAVAFVVISCKGKLGEAESLNLEEVPVQTVDDMFIVQTKNGCIEMRARLFHMNFSLMDSLYMDIQKMKDWKLKL